MRYIRDSNWVVVFGNEDKELIQFLVNTKNHLIYTSPPRRQKGYPATTTPYSVIIRKPYQEMQSAVTVGSSCNTLTIVVMQRLLSSLLSYFLLKVRFAYLLDINTNKF